MRPRALLTLLLLLTTACAPMVTLEAGDPVRRIRQPQTSRLLAADGRVLAELHGEQDRDEVALDDVDPLLTQAVLAVEDRRYFLHAGVDLAAIVRAAVRNVSAGEIAQGGSTITQQYVKNTITGPAQTLERKIEEAALAWQLEQHHSKQDILGRYLNTAYFGQGAYGVAAASRHYFGREPTSLTLVQAAQLAGMIASPSRFDPYDHPEAAHARRAVVLRALVGAGVISQDEADAAGTGDVGLVDQSVQEQDLAPYVVAEVKRLLQHDPQGLFGILGTTVDERADVLFTGGLRVHTTVDLTMQAQAEQAVASVLDQEGDPSAALVAIDPATGAVRALVGGRDYNDPDDPFARFNLATQGRRQPGSSFKPIVLATALSLGISPDRRFPAGDCVTFPQIPDWQPCNYGGTSYPELTLREATVHSVNTVYARLAVELGPQAIVQTAHALGIDDDLPSVASIGLGTAELSPWDLAEAYTPFATLGTQHPVHLIDRIEEADGTVLWEHDDETRRVLDQAVSWLITQTLTEVVARGTGVRAKIDRPQAGKTGTAQDNSDAWFVGYTPDLVASVWVGFPEGRVAMRPPTTREVVEGGRWPAQIWAAFAGAALADVPARGFPVPDLSIVTIKVDVTRDCLPNLYTPADVVELREYVRGAEPTQRCTEPAGPPIDDVPMVVGLPLATARRLLADEGFLVDVRQEVSALYPTGIVARQRPVPGATTLERDGNAVVIWVSTAVRTRSAVPDVVGLDVDDAQTVLELTGWVVEVRRSCGGGDCQGLSADEVWAQTPEGGEVARDHSLVVLTAAPASP